MPRTKMMQRLRSFLSNKRAATAIEYAIIAGGIAAAVAGAITVLGTSVVAKWASVAAALR